MLSAQIGAIKKHSGAAQFWIAAGGRRDRRTLRNATDAARPECGTRASEWPLAEAQRSNGSLQAPGRLSSCVPEGLH